jgi:hypothetical protein
MTLAIASPVGQRRQLGWGLACAAAFAVALGPYLLVEAARPSGHRRGRSLRQLRATRQLIALLATTVDCEERSCWPFKRLNCSNRHRG